MLAAMNPLLNAGQIMTYVVSGTASGSVQSSNGNSTDTFSNVALTITGTADVNTLGESPAFGFNEIDFQPGAALLTISGLGSATFSNLVFIVDNYRNGVLVLGGSFTPTTGLDIVEMTDSDVGSNVFSTYFLDTSIGPVGPAPDEAVASWQNIQTSFGGVTVTSYDDVTFSAAAVPEPGSLMTTIGGLALLLVLASASRRNTASKPAD